MIGKTAEFYFKSAMKHLTRNEVASAIEELHKGLVIQPDHLLCRFNHGAIMFKLGLMLQAKHDFELLASNGKNNKEHYVFFNLALT